ncbi:hypothetical protein FRY77_20910 [Halomonas sp. MG34]|nr:hypothetical protein [Halomonas sp. MG34]
MMKTESLKKLGILGVSFGLMASPLAFAQVDSSDEYEEPTPQEETTQDDQGTYNSYDTEQDKGPDVGTEYEEEEEQEVPATDEEEDDSGW